MSDVKLPKLPAFVPSQLGPVPVTLVDRIEPEKGEEYIFGRYSTSRRVIEISRESSHVMQWQTLFHEWAHVVMIDAGLHHGMTEALQEQMCDAFGTARVVELREALRGQQAGRKRR